MLDPIRSTSTYRDVAEIVEAQGAYRATRAYRTALERAARGKPVCRNFVALRSPALVEGYFRRTAELCRSLARHGLRRLAEHARAAHAFCDLRIRRPWVELAESDIGIAIGASGEVYRFASGKHRTAAAQALGLRAIPVEVRMVHAEWLRSVMAASGLPPIAALLRGIGALDRGRPSPADWAAGTAVEPAGLPEMAAAFS
jgi:hypothetical protein